MSHGDAPARVSETTYEALELDWTCPSRDRIKFGRGHQHVWDDDQLADVTDRVLEKRRVLRGRLDRVTRMQVDRDCGRLMLALHDTRQAVDA